jgi:hypothetical protein
MYPQLVLAADAEAYIAAVCDCVQKLCCQDPPGRGLVVLHLAVQGHEPCNSLDECLEQAADQYRCAEGGVKLLAHDLRTTCDVCRHVDRQLVMHGGTEQGQGVEYTVAQLQGCSKQCFNSRSSPCQCRWCVRHPGKSYVCPGLC